MLSSLNLQILTNQGQLSESIYFRLQESKHKLVTHTSGVSLVHAKVKYNGATFEYKMGRSCCAVYDAHVFDIQREIII